MLKKISHKNIPSSAYNTRWLIRLNNLLLSTLANRSTFQLHFPFVSHARISKSNISILALCPPTSVLWRVHVCGFHRLHTQRERECV